jgi:hypothetical protein
MAATESRTGFRLPWSTEDKANGQRADEPQDADSPADVESTETHEAEGAPTAEAATAEPAQDASSASADHPEPGPPTNTGNHEEASVHPTAATTVSDPRKADSARQKPTKFLADLTRAMQAAAEASRAATMEQFQAEAKTHIEQVHLRSADEATELRKGADEDIVDIRDWSKSELARIREDTDRKITQRKADLDVELEEHAARIEKKAELVQARVASFEAEMDRFFERLRNEDDPAEFAAMAENLPEPPSLDLFDDSDFATTTRAAAVETAIEPVAEESTPVAEATAGGTTENTDVPTAEAAAGEAEPATDESQPAEGAAETVIGADDQAENYAVQDDPAAVEAAMAAIEAAYQAAESDKAKQSADASAGEDAAASDPDDPRLAALGMSQDLGAAEAEAAAAAADTSDEEIPTIDDDALAARLAGLVPPAGSAAPTPKTAAPKAAATSQVVVTGLVSVASIASFKRHLGRVQGVQSVGVSSGPDGEFVFKVAHGADVSLADAVPTLPGFEARVTGTGDGVVNVSARDPESEG